MIKFCLTSDVTVSLLPPASEGCGKVMFSVTCVWQLEGILSQGAEDLWHDVIPIPQSQLSRNDQGGRTGHPSWKNQTPFPNASWDTGCGGSLAVGFRMEGFLVSNNFSYLIFVYVRVIFVMNSVRKFPHVIRCKNKAVHESSNCVVEPLVVGERIVSTIVSNDKYGCEECSLYSPIQQQGCVPQYWAKTETDMCNRCVFTCSKIFSRSTR